MYQTLVAKIYDEKISQLYARIVHAYIKNCWGNSLSAAFAYTKRNPSTRVFYVEGFVYDYRFPLFYEHGWFETDENIFDPTRILHPYSDHEYFAGVRFEIGKDCTDLRTAKKNLPLIRKYGYTRHEGYRCAYEEVFRYAQSKNEESLHNERVCSNE